MASLNIFVACLVILGVTIGPAMSAPLQRKESPQKIEELKNKLQDLQKVLQDLEQKLSSKPAARGLSEDTANAKLEAFESKLSESDRELVNNMQSKLKYLKAALENDDDSDKETEKREEETDTDNGLLEKYPSFAHFLEAAKASVRDGTESTDDERHAEDGDPDLQQYLQKLNPQDKDLLQAHPSKINLLRKALHQKVDEDEGTPEKPKTDKTEDQEKILDAMKSKLEELKAALQKERQEKCKNDPPNSNCNNEPETKISEGHFGEIVKVNKQDQHERKELSSGWMQGPINDIKDAKLTKVELERCKPGSDCECKDGDCNNDDATHEQKVQQVKKKLLDDLSNAKATGVSTKELLKALLSKRRERRVIDEDSSAKQRLFM